MNSPSEGALTNPMQVASLSVLLCCDHDRVRLGYPHYIDGKSHNDPLASLSPGVQAEARLVAAETFADWERAGGVGITNDRLKRMQQYIQAWVQATTNKETTA